MFTCLFTYTDLLENDYEISPTIALLQSLRQPYSNNFSSFAVYKNTVSISYITKFAIKEWRATCQPIRGNLLISVMDIYVYSTAPSPKETLTITHALPHSHPHKHSLSLSLLKYRNKLPNLPALSGSGDCHKRLIMPANNNIHE